jgi:uncharacterized SAM-binding protein YcdF (DUF218 family)
MSLQATATALLLPPSLLLLAAMLGGLIAWRGERWGGALAAGAALMVLVLATPMAAGMLRWSLEAQVTATTGGPVPGAIVVLSAEVARGADGPEVGPLTLERLRAGAALHRATGLPVLVSGGPAAPGEPAIATLMATVLLQDFAVPVRWQEARAKDTAQNAERSAALLLAEGIGSVHLVTHGWHLPRAQAAFTRAGLATAPAPVRISPRPDGRASDWVPSPRQLGDSWYFLREWAGRLVYALRHGAAAPAGL